MIIPSHFVINGVPALLSGQDCGRVFLHVHGQFGCKEEASRLAEIVCPRGYQVLSVDLPGHGEHWFHTPEQLGVLENWIRNETERKDGE